MHDIIKAMTERITSGLQRNSVTTPSRWAEKYRVMGAPFPGKWSWKHHPWLKGMHDSSHEMNVGQKSAQMGFTETVLNLTFFNIDVKNSDCLYVLPAKSPDASDFSSGRFDPALELSPHLKNLFSDVRNVGHKRAGSANLYVRGSKSRGGLKSVPVGFIVLDEVDEMNKENIPLALERTSGQLEYQQWLISTPTLPEVGINKYFMDSTQDHYHFKCPGCSKLTELLFPECLEIFGEDPSDPRVHESHLKCKECKVKLHQETKTEWLADGVWVPSFTNKNYKGWGISQLYSTAKKAMPGALAELFLRGEHDPASATEFHNSKLGQTYTAEGAQINDSDIAAHTGYYVNNVKRTYGPVTMGIDVGKYLHVTIDDWTLGEFVGDDVNTYARPRTVFMGKFLHFDELDKLMLEWRILQAVCDANPETRSALQFANRFYGIVRLCIYSTGVYGKDIQASKETEHTVLVNRTSWMDLALSRFHREEMITIPSDTPFEYKQHLKAPIRVYKQDKNGNPVGYYDNRGLDDHYAHSRVYSELALKFAVAQQPNRDIKSPL